MKRPKLVIYHRGCADGFCCAWLFHHAFPDAEFVAAQYGDAPPDVADREVFIADFSYKRPVMRHILGQAHAVTVLDHHATAEAELGRVDSMSLTDEFSLRPDLIQNEPGSELPRIWFDMTKSGGRMTWEFLHTAGAFNGTELGALKSPPWLVDYTEDRDLWKHALPNTKELNACIRSYPFAYAIWDMLHEHGAHEGRAGFIREGGAIMRVEANIVENHVKHARDTQIGGYTVPCVNATVLHLQSEICEKLAEGRPFGACYFDRGDGVRVYSLRSRGETGIDVSEVAAKLGGGGHRAASGFQTPVPGKG